MHKICSIEGCENPVRARGWCLKHWTRWQRYGDPNHPFLIAKDGESFQYVLDHMHDGCSYHWPYGTINGYAQITVDEKQIRASRWVCEQVNGPAFSGKSFALHKCGKGYLGCFNADCLYWGTRKDNSRDAIIHGTWKHGETHGSAKLSDEEITEIRRLYVTGDYFQWQLADTFNVVQQHISDIVNFRTRIS